MTTTISGDSTSTFGSDIDVTGAVITDAPAFSAYANAGQTLSSATWTKISFGAEEFDTNSCFDNVTNNRFTPNIEGYYQVNAQLQPNNSYTGGAIRIYKNGSDFKTGNFALSTSFGGFVISTLVYLNGSTDYIEVYGNFTTGQPVASGPSFSHFSAFLARAV